MGFAQFERLLIRRFVLLRLRSIVTRVRMILVFGYSPLLGTGQYYEFLSYPILILLGHLDASSVTVASRRQLQGDWGGAKVKFEASACVGNGNKRCY